MSCETVISHPWVPLGRLALARRTGENRVEVSRSDDVAPAFSVYQASIAMIAIFHGFVFSGLLAVLTKPHHLTRPDRISLYALLAAMLFLTTGLVFLDATGHRIIEREKFLYPRGWLPRVAAIAVGLGIWGMYGGIAALLWARRMHVVSIVLLVTSAALVVIGFVLHNDNKTELIELDARPNLRNRDDPAQS
jgi:hypothetical protein